MSDLISREAAVAEIIRSANELADYGLLGPEKILKHHGLQCIAAVPSVEPSPVMGHARWHRDSPLTNYGCTHCGTRTWDRGAFCHGCGYCMDEPEPPREGSNGK